MTRKKTDKKMPRLEPQFHDVLVCKKNDFRPFLEIMIEEPENISRQNLGVLVGIFQIDDHSEDSSYVVNYLISIIKKEYFSRANRGPVENFEAALHKANLALSKLASHENIGWIGKINAICAVIEKNNILLSQTGNASAFLFRGSTLTEITDLPDDSLDSNPLKTFQDVISGKIEKTDKLLFTTKEIFDIFSLEEIKKSALKFSRQNFVQFLNTALINELEQVATLVIDIDEKIEELIEPYPEKKIEEMNVFSQTAFRKDPSPQILEKERAKEELLAKERQEIIQELNEDERDFVDQKTGHIYIKEPHDLPSQTEFQKPPLDFSIAKEKFSDLASLSLKALVGAKNKTKDATLSVFQKSAAKISEISSRKKARTIEKLNQKTQALIELDKRAEESALPKATTPITEKIEPTFPKLDLEAKTALLLKKIEPGFDWLREKTADGLVLILRKPTILTIKTKDFLKNKWREYDAKKTAQTDVAISDKHIDADKPTSDTTTQLRYPWENVSPAISQKVEPEKPVNIFLKKIASFGRSIELGKILPDFSRLKLIVKNLDQKQKISAVAILFLLLVVPYLIVRWEREPEKKPAVIEEAPALALPLEKDLNVSRIEKLDEVYAGNVGNILNLNDKFFALAGAEIIDLENKKNFSLPSDFQNPDLFVGMMDLKSIFLIKSDRIISFSPVTGKFQDVKLNFPPNGKIVDAKTYLTYIYLLDAGNNQIYRYPRAEGGFGEKTAWLKDDVELKDASKMAINDNIFVLSDKEIIKLFKYKKQPFSIENTATTIIPDKLYTEQNIGNLYVLDKTNSRVIKLDNDGKILAQYYNATLKNATDFSVSEENNLIYISDASGVKSFEMNQ